MEYKEYVHLWLDGIYDEIAFWKNCMETGGAAISKSRWKKQLDKNRMLRKKSFGLQILVQGRFQGAGALRINAN